MSVTTSPWIFLAVLLTAGTPQDPVFKLDVMADAPGNDHYNPNGEWATVRLEEGSPTMDLNGWQLCDAAQHCYTFPVGASLEPGASLQVHTGKGESGGSRFYMGRNQAVWNNRGGDTATLYDPAGRVVAQYTYR